MAKLTTGIFEVPATTVGTDGFPNIACISLNNRTAFTRSVSVVVVRCPLGADGEQIIFSQQITLGPRSCTFRGVDSYSPLDTLRVDFAGDIDEDGETVTASVVGRRSSDGSLEPTMFFRHGNLVEL
ncbi:MAG TPA: hypothetical protein VGK74_23520 [Symbiobacteriaceae bacterium]